MTINQAAGQADPASSTPIQFTAAFSAAVKGFTGTDVNFAGSTAGGTLKAAVTGISSTYTISVSGMTSAGKVVVAIPAGAALGPQNAPSLASTSSDNSVTWRPASQQQSPPPGGSSVALLSACHSRRPCVTARHGKSLPLKVRCEGPVSCVGEMTITYVSRRGHARSASKPKASTLGKLRFSFSAGAEEEPRIPLTKKARRLLAAHPHVRATLSIALGSATNTYPISFGLPPKS